MIRNIFLDADDTLFDFHRSERQALQETLRQIGVLPTEEILALYSSINQAHWKMLEQGEITREELRVKRYERFLAEIGAAVAPSRAAAIYEDALARGHFFIEGAERLIKTLSGEYHLYILTNGFAKTQNGRLASAGVRAYFKDVFISQELGADKPSEQFFEACFARIPQFRREEAILVGDSLTSDILGGNRMGICTVWFNPREVKNQTEIHPDYEISRLEQLYSILNNLYDS